ncbi:unnamed protein product [Clonostachys rosea]|uniref:Structure-specific endonuclease subunit SLX4 n=1 Tax=Bionectria ochroleuca TaxID=29856 RepID=A0ABY6ULA3_BIOOC|nr:unnamed protein product [Clonostachys rosea]
MKRKRDSSATAAAQSFSVRWHSIANPATPSVDIMSSPDPLNDDTMTSIFPPSSRRVTRSQRSTRFASLASSPRKQTFELEVGDNVSPQRLLVTVETEDGNPAGTTRRRLFPSSSPLRNPRPGAGMTTTTTVPLRQSIEDEQVDLTLDSMATPRRRGRPRKTNGTPMPSAAKKRKAGTPIKQRTPRRQSTINELDPLSDPVIQPTPTPRKRGRPRKTNTVEPSSEFGLESATKIVSGRRGRRRRQALIPEELEEMAEEAAVLPEDVLSENDIDLIEPPPEAFTDEPQLQTVSNVEMAQPPADLASDFDLWMNEASPERTPRAPTQPVALDPADSRRSPSADYESIASLNDDFGGAPSPSPGIQSRSTASPEVVESRQSAAPDNGDTIAQGEDFSMIFMESIQSFQDFRSSVPGPRQPLPLPDSDIDEEASLIINKTLESLRQSVRQEEQKEDEEDLEMVQEVPEPEQQDEGAEEPAETEEARTTQELPRGSPDKDDMRSELLRTSPSVARDQDELASDETTPVFSPAFVSSPNRLLSPRWAKRGLRRPNISPLRHRLLKSQAKQLDDAPTVSEREDTAPEASHNAQATQTTQSHEDDYEDSFSEIPQTVLEAATPRRPTSFVPAPEEPASEGRAIEEQAPEEEDDDDQVELIEESEEEEVEPINDVLVRDFTPVEDLTVPEAPEEAPEALRSDEFSDPQELEEQQSRLINNPYPSHQHLPPPSNASSAAQTDRLPTPDDTPPNLQAEPSEDLDKPEDEAMRSSPLVPQLQLESQPISSPVTSDPLTEQPLPTERPAVSIEITPVNQLSSPANEPQSVAAESPMERAARPALSAIVRAGRALQTITSDPPSPEPQEHQLGSPFRSSVSKDSWSGSREGATGRRSNIISPSRRSIGHQRQSASIDDPFISASRNTGQSSFMQALGWSMSRQQSPDKSRPQPSGSTSSSMRATPPDDGMSWVANEGPISPRLRGDNSLREAAGLPATVADQAPNPQNEMEEKLTSNLHQAEELSQQDDETDIWELEAERSLLDPAPEQSSQDVFSASHRRGTIPSPWTKQSTWSREQATAQATEASVGRTAEITTNPDGHAHSEADSTEEYSLLAQRQAAPEGANEPAALAKESRVDLSSFFSSPAAIPGMLVNKLFPSRTSNVGPSDSLQAESAPAIATTSMFPQVASNPFRQQSESPTNMVSPSKSSAPPSSRKRSSSAPVGHEENNPNSTVGRDPSSPFRSSGVSNSRRASAGPESGSPATPEKIEMPIVAQKQNFTPRPRQPSQSFFQPSSSAPTPPRMQLSHADIQRWQQETSNASESSPDLGRTLLRPLPPRNASPTKSSLRSPLKPHTPGRVVEFTSSVLSPMEQARVRHERRLSNTSSSGLAAVTQNQPVSREEPVTVIEGKENHDSDISMSDASPLPKQRNANLAPVAAAPPTGESSSSASFSKKLSPTLWTREHWLFLDRILERRLVGDFDVDFPRRAEKYLGKKVKSQGEAMVLERWHLDCVDAFRAVVGGWDEGDLAKRLFSLILAEERRKRMRGHTTNPSAMMFH